MFSRIHWRIAASYAALIALVLAALGVYLVAFLREQQVSTLEAQLARQARLIADDARHVLRGEGTETLDDLAKRLGADIGARVTLIGIDGTVLGDSEGDPRGMENHGTRPEVVQALAEGRGQSQRHSSTLDRDLLYVAVPMQDNGNVLGVARLALSVREVEEALGRVAVAVASAIAVAALLAVPLAILLARMTARRIEHLTEAARRLAGGALDLEIPMEGRDEVATLAHAFNEMATRLRGDVHAIEHERARLAAVLAHMADGVVIADRNGAVRLINPAAARLLRVSSAGVEGKSLIAVVRDHELADLVRRAVAGASRSVEPRIVELGSSGQKRAVRALASRIPGAAPGDEQVLLVLQDVTDLRQAETMRREFVANVSHELRTPVTGLKAMVETLEGGAMEEREVARGFLSRMHVEVDGLAQLVEELLELSRIESGNVALRPRTVDLGELVRASAERLRPLAERQGLHLELAVPDDLPSVEADPERVQQVVVNLVHNAVKFTPPEGTVTVGAETRDSEVAVFVADTGRGIAPEALPRLFERFYKVDKARASEGTGLGLAICKHLVQIHGGRILAESEGEGRGARFTFVLPARGTSEPSSSSPTDLLATPPGHV